jgi:hypothetical protein
MSLVVHWYMDNMNEIIKAQNERILTLQLLVESLVDELIETKKVKEEKLDDRFRAKMEWAQEQLNKARNEMEIEYINTSLFGGKMGEA